ncbi:MAG: universal stress protein [Dehalococcoidia bacterium]
MYKRILVPLDGTELAEAILPHATELARRFEATLVLLRATTSLPEAMRQTIAPEPMAAVPVSVDVAESLVEIQEDAAERYLQQIGGRLKAEGVTCEALVVQGDASVSLAEAVKTQHIDLIAMATHARSTFGRLLHGSVAESILHEVRVPVLLLHAE